MFHKCFELTVIFITDQRDSIKRILIKLNSLNNLFALNVYKREKSVKFSFQDSIAYEI